MADTLTSQNAPCSSSELEVTGPFPALESSRDSEPYRIPTALRSLRLGWALVWEHTNTKSFRIGIFQCLIRFVRMTRVSSRDSVKCRMSRTLFSCLKIDHRPDRLSGSGWSFGSPCSRTCLPDWTSIIKSYSYVPLSSIPTYLPPTMIWFIRWRRPCMVRIRISLTTSPDRPNLSWQVTQRIRMVPRNYNDRKVNIRPEIC